MKYYLIVRDERKETNKKLSILVYDEYDDAIDHNELLDHLAFPSVSHKVVAAHDYVDMRKKYPNY